MRRELILPGCRPIAAYADITDEQWHELRRGGIGGSDASVIMGANRYSTPLSLWMEKTGRMVNEIDSEFAEMGTLMEPWIRRELVAPWLEEHRNMSDFNVIDPAHVYQSNDWPWMRANIDGLVLNRDEDTIVGLEIKTGSSYVMKEWGGREGDEIPDAYYWQVQHYMAVTGLDEWYVFGVIGNQRLLRVVPRNDRDIARLVEASRDFWDLVKLNDPLYAPMATGHDADMNALMALGSPQDDATVDLSDIKGELELYEESRLTAKGAKEAQDWHKQQIIAALGPHKYGTGGGYRATFSRFERSSFDTARFKKDHPDLYQEYVSYTESGRLSVREEKK